ASLASPLLPYTTLFRSTSSGAAATEAGVLPLELVRALPAGRGLPRAGAATAPQSRHVPRRPRRRGGTPRLARALQDPGPPDPGRSEEHTSELQSPDQLV